MSLFLKVTQQNPYHPKIIYWFIGAMFDILNQATLAVFAEPFTYKGNGSLSILLQGVFGDQVSQEAMAGAGFGDRVYNLQLLQTTVAANAIGLRDTVEVRGVGYQVIDLQTDSTGLTTLHLRRY
jgi:hypothetical protein